MKCRVKAQLKINKFIRKIDNEYKINRSIIYNNGRSSSQKCYRLGIFLFCFLFLFRCIPLPLFLSAHDSDVKEANKQKCQEPGQQQQGQTVYQTSGQHLHHPTLQYSHQHSLAPNQRSTSYLSHSTSNLQAPTGSQLSSSQITTSLEPKSNVSNGAYQVNMHYTCTAPCFDR